MNKKYIFWFILGAYGVWFAILSGSEEIFSGKYWKVIFAVVLGVVSYLLIERVSKK